MQKEEFSQTFARPRNPTDYVPELCTLIPQIRISQPPAPKFLTDNNIGIDSAHIDEIYNIPTSIHNSLPTSNADEQSSDFNSSVTATPSHCSGFSKITVDRDLFLNIMRKRKEHPIFTSLEPLRLSEALWYYLEDREGQELGPFNSEEMNKRFNVELLNEQTQIRQKLDEQYRPLSFYVKRYYKSVVCNIHNLRRSSVNVPTKTVRFAAEELLPRRAKRMSDAPRPLNREERFFSHATRPRFTMQHLIPSEEEESELPVEHEEEDDQEGFEISCRDRSTTLTQLSERPRIK